MGAPPEMKTIRARRPSPSAIAALLVLGVGAILATDLVVLDPERHADSHGPLGSLRDGTTIGMSAVAEANRTVTFGLGLCIADDSASATVESISPALALGSGVRFLGARSRSLDWTDGSAPPDTIGAVEGFPPPNLDPSGLSDAVGFVVTHRCVRQNPTTYTELLLGFTADGTASGGWHGVDVRYRSGWRQRVVTIQYNLFMCLPAEPDCIDDLLSE